LVNIYDGDDEQLPGDDNNAWYGNAQLVVVAAFSPSNVRRVIRGDEVVAVATLPGRLQWLMYMR